MSEADLAGGYRWNDRLATLINHLLVSLMLASVVVTITQLVEYLSPGWKGTYLVVAVFIFTLEGMYTRRLMEHEFVFSREWFLFRGTEWIVIIVLLKLVIYAVRGFDRLWADIPLWRQDFLQNFFTPEYFFSLFIVALCWILGTLFSGELVKLEGDEKLLLSDEDPGIYVQRVEVRQKLVDLILIIGGIMIFIASFVRLDWDALWQGRDPLRAPVYNILLYFVLSLVLLSLTQFSILRVGWIMERTPVSRNLVSRWFIYGLAFLAVLAIISSLLPTRYSVGLLDILAMLFALLSALVSLLVFLVFTPIFFLMSLLAAMTGKEQSGEPPKLPQFPVPPAGAPAGPELIKSLVFWLVFIGVIGFSIYYYLQQHKEVVESLRRIPLLRWLIDGLGWLRNWVQGVNRGIAAAVQAGRSRMARRRVASSVAPWHFVNLRKLSPRQRVMFFYLAMVRRSGEQGLPRQPFQTPYEFSSTLTAQLPDVEGDVSSLTEEFIEARYTQHEITPEHAGAVQSYWERIKRALRRALHGEEM